MTRAQLKISLEALLINNLTGDIEADEVLAEIEQILDNIYVTEDEPRYPERTAGGVLVDGASIPVDLAAVIRERWPSFLNTSESVIAIPLSNFGSGVLWILVVYKAIAGTCVITFSGTNLMFVDLTADTKVAPASSVVITLDDAAKTVSVFSILNTGNDDPDTVGSKIVTITKV